MENLLVAYFSAYKRKYNPLTNSYQEWETISEKVHNALPNDGHDWIHAQTLTNTSAGTRGAGFICLSNNATMAAGDTDLVGLITTNGLGPADATTKNHVDNSNSTLMEHTFTASGAQTGIVKVGLKTASTGGILTHQGTITSTDLQTNDQLKISITINTTVS